jgi:SSS family solute:Na+ symporter
MLWARPSATAGFFGMLGGLSASASEYVLYRCGILHFVSPMAANLWSAAWGLCGGVVVMVTLSFFTRPPDVARLKGLVATRGQVVAVSGQNLAWFRQPWFYAAIVLGLFTALNLIFF